MFLLKLHGKIVMMKIHRNKLEELKTWYRDPETIVVLGPRQVGKTTLVKTFLSWVKEEKNLPESNIFAYNLDLKKDKQALEDQTKLFERLTSLKGKKLVFIDEIQRMPEPGIFLKGLIDTIPEVKFIVTGSSSLEIRSKIADVLTGRKHEIELSPLSYQEARTVIEDPLPELLVRGGYPAVFTTPKRDKKMARLNEIVKSYLQNDINDFLGIELMDKYVQLMTLLSGQIGGLVNHSHLTNVLNIHLNTLERYLSILQNTFILDFIYPFGNNPSREIIKAPIPYFIDLGIRNHFLGAFQPLEQRNDRGLLFQNFVYTELRRLVPAFMRIRYWRTKNQQEVDFVVGHELEQIPVEVKYTDLEKPEITSSMKIFIQTYTPKQFVVVNKSFSSEMWWNNTKIQFIPISELEKEFTKTVKV